MSLFGPPDVNKMYQKGDVAGLTKALEYKIGANDGTNVQVRCQAAKLLGELRNPQSIGPLIAMLARIPSSERASAGQALLRFGDQARAQLISALKSGETGVRQEAAVLLGQVGGAGVVDALIAALRDSDGLVRRNSVKSLGDLNDGRAFEPVLQALVRKDYNVRAAAIEALGKFMDPRCVEPLIGEMNDPYHIEEYKPAIIAVLSRFNDPRVTWALIGEVRDPKNNWKAKQAVFKMLMECKDPRVSDLFLEILTTKQKDVSLASQRVVHGSPDADAVKPRSEMEEDWYGCLYAARALGEWGDRRAEGVLIQVMEDTYHWWELRKAAAEALGKIGTLRALPALTAAADNYGFTLRPARKIENDRVRQAAAQALEKIQANPANQAADFDTLMERLKSDKQEIRAATSTAIVKMGEPAVDPLIARLKDPDPVMRKWAASLLGQLHATRAMEPLLAMLATCRAAPDKEPEVYTAVMWSLGMIGDARAVDELIAALKGGLRNLADQKSEEVKYAAEALARIADRRAVEPLLLVLRFGSPAVEIAALEALGKLGDERAVEPVIATFSETKDEDVRKSAARALVALGDSRGVHPLVASFENIYRDWYYRQEIARGLVKMYHSGRLDDEHKALILKLRPEITAPHTKKLIERRAAEYGERGQISDPGSSYFEESGFELEFPL